MKPAPFQYHDPSTLDEAVAIAAAHEDVRPLAGGQSLVPMMNFRFVQPGHLVDLNGVDELSGIAVERDKLKFGAMTRQRRIAEAAEIGEASPIIREALAHVGHRQTRARGTIGGSLSHFDPAAELCNLAALHDAELELSSARGKRRLRFCEFGLGYLMTAIEPDELLSSIAFRRWPAGHGFAFEEFAMRRGDFAICAVSCLVAADRKGRIAEIAVAVSGLEPVPARLSGFEAAAKGQTPTDELFSQAAREAEALEAMSDAYVTAEYRRHLARILTRRAVKRATERARSDT